MTDDPVDTLKSNDSLSLGAKSASQPNDLNCQCHGCASLDSNLHQFGDYFQSEIDILKERFLIFAASPLVSPRWKFGRCQSSKRESGSQGKAIRDRNKIREFKGRGKNYQQWKQEPCYCITTETMNFQRAMKVVICIQLLAKVSRPSKDQIIATPSSHRNAIIKGWGKFISNLTNCLQVEVMDLNNNETRRRGRLLYKKIC